MLYNIYCTIPYETLILYEKIHIHVQIYIRTYIRAYIHTYIITLLSFYSMINILFKITCFISSYLSILILLKDFSGFGVIPRPGLKPTFYLAWSTRATCHVADIQGLGFRVTLNPCTPKWSFRFVEICTSGC